MIIYMYVSTCVYRRETELDMPVAKQLREPCAREFPIIKSIPKNDRKMRDLKKPMREHTFSGESIRKQVQNNIRPESKLDEMLPNHAWEPCAREYRL